MGSQGASALEGGLGLGLGVGKVKRKASSFYDPTGQRGTGYNPSASSWGGRPGGLADYSANLNTRRNDVENRQAFLADFAQADADRAMGLQARSGAMNTADMIAARARGDVPSIAQMQADRQMQQAQAAQAAQAASARGNAARALAAQGAAGNIANAQSAISGQAQINAAQERERAEANAVGAYQGIRQGDQASQNLSANQAQFQSQMQQRNRESNDSRAMGYEQLDANAQQAQLNAKMQEQAILASSHNAADAANQKTAAKNADTDKGFFSKLFSDERTKMPLDLGGGGPGAAGPGSPWFEGSDPNSGPGIGLGPILAANERQRAFAGSDPTDFGGGEAGFLSDTNAKKSALLEQGRRQGAQEASGAPRMQFSPAQGWHFPEDPEDAVRKAQLDRAIGSQVEQDRAKQDRLKALQTQYDEEDRRARDPAVGLGRAPKGYAKMRAAQQAPELADEDKGLAPGSADFWKTSPEKKASYNPQTHEWKSEFDAPPKDDSMPWWATPLDVTGSRGLFLSDARAKRSAFEAGVSAASKAIMGNDGTNPDRMVSDEVLHVAKSLASPASIIPAAANAAGAAYVTHKANADREAAAKATEDQRVTPPTRMVDAVAESNRTLAGQPYAYKPGFAPDQKPGEPNFGPMAQNMEKSPIAATAVKQDPQTGLRMIDRDKALKVTMSGVAGLQRQMDRLKDAIGSRVVSAVRSKR